MYAIITVGLGFGDEGKGSCVDYLAEVNRADLVIRYNGGHQAAHNVVRNGVHHCFSQFGSATLQGIPTYLDRNVIIEPIAMLKEANHFKEFGINPYDLLTVNPDCLVTTKFHKLANIIKETYNKHGSCGVGIGETRRLENNGLAIYSKDLDNYPSLYNKLYEIKDYYLEDLNKFKSEDTLGHFQNIENFDIDEYACIYKTLKPKTGECPKFKLAIFEGAQGVLLDQDFGFFPHVTYSHTTDKHAVELCNDLDVEYEIMGITRTYHTRHGNGPFPTNTTLWKSIYKHIHSFTFDDHNKSNKYQGDFKFGYFDDVLFQYAISINPVDHIFLTHSEYKLDKVCKQYRLSDGSMLDSLEFPVSTEMLNSVTPIYEEIDSFDYIKKKYYVKYISFGKESGRKIRVG